MSLRSDLILALNPENSISGKACRLEKNARRAQNLFNNKVLTLKFSCPPKNLKQGFACGSCSESCDLLFSGHSAEPVHFFITYNTSSGLLLVVNESIKGTLANQTNLEVKGQSIVLEHQMKIEFGSYKFTILIPERREGLQMFLTNQSHYLGSMINTTTPTAVLSRHTTPGHVMNRIGPYLEVAQLGAGSYGEVILLCTKATGNLFAAKRFGAELTTLAEMKEEAATLRQLSHRNIVEFREIIEQRESVILVMEYLHSGSLFKLHPLAPALTVEVIEQCLDALQYIHSQGIIHRDIKLDNIILQTIMPMRVKIIDFGLAIASRNRTGRVGATYYTAPEMLSSNAHTTALDIWALGMVILEMGQLFPHRAARQYLGGYDQPRFNVFYRAIGQVVESTSEPLHGILRLVLYPDPVDRVTAELCLQLLGLNRRGLICNFEDLS